MAGKTLTRDDLRDAIQRALPKLSGKEAVRLIEETLREVERRIGLGWSHEFKSFREFRRPFQKGADGAQPEDQDERRHQGAKGRELQMLP